MYVECDFLLALIKEDDWLGAAAESVYRDHREGLWTSAYTLLELMFVARRADRDVLATVVAAKELIEVRGDVEAMLAAASYVEDHGMTPFDALHLVQSQDDTIVSSDGAYDDFSDRVPLESLVED